MTLDEAIAALTDLRVDDVAGRSPVAFWDDDRDMLIQVEAPEPHKPSADFAGSCILFHRGALVWEIPFVQATPQHVRRTKE